MTAHSRRRTGALTALALTGALTLAACGADDPLATETTGGGDDGAAGGDGQTLVIGSQDYYSNEIIAEAYAQALSTLVALAAPVDAFFDRVMVLCDEPLLRAQRLALLRELWRLMNQVADLSVLAREAGA